MRKIKNKLIQKLLAALVIGGSSAVIGIGLSLWNPFNEWHLKIANTLYTRQDPSQDIVIVAIDDASIKDSLSGGLGHFYDWPRSYLAQVLENIEKGNPKAIGVDLLLDETSKGISKTDLLNIFNQISTLTLTKQKDTMFEFVKKFNPFNTHPSDLALSQALQNFTNIVIIAKFESGALTLPNKIFWKSADDLGLFNFNRDDDGAIRSLQPSVHTAEGTTYESLALNIAERVSDIDLKDIPLDENGTMMINYFGAPFSFKMIPYVDVYNGKNLEQFNNKIVLIGATAGELGDHFPVPTSSRQRTSLGLENEMPGVEIHANIIQTLLDKQFLSNQSKASQILTIAAIAFAAALILIFLSIWLGIAVPAVLTFGYLWAAHFAYQHGVIVNMVYPFFAILITYLGSLVYKYFAEVRAKKFIETAFGRYLSPSVMNEVLKNPDLLHLGGMKKTVTVFFSDIAGFTSISEKLDPEHLIRLINDYLSAMTNVVLSHRGTLDKYVGDAIVAYFGAPISQEDHAIKACHTALEMRKTLTKLHQKWQTENMPLVDFRIGINTGDVIVGNVGSEARFDYTIMGDEVNLGSRLEGANKRYGTHIMISESTYTLVQNDFIVRELDHIKVKGKEKPVRVYELLARKGELSETGQKLLAPYNEGMKQYLVRNFDEAYKNFKEALEVYPEDGPSKLYMQRCDILRDFPPPSDWDGVFTMKEK